jgi:hypothetical protein
MIKKAVQKNRNYKVGKCKPPLDKAIKKGEIRNPNGYNISPERRALKDITELELATAIKKVFTSTEEECLELVNDPTITLGHKLILKSALDATEHGNYTKFNEILERVIGKVPSRVDATSKGESLSVPIVDATQIRAIMKQLEEEY